MEILEIIWKKKLNEGDFEGFVTIGEKIKEEFEDETVGNLGLFFCKNIQMISWYIQNVALSIVVILQYEGQDQDKGVDQLIIEESYICSLCVI